MIPITTRTRMPHRPFVMLDQRGEEDLVLVVKATYWFDESAAVTIAEEQESIRPNDIFWDVPGKSSIRVPSDLAPRKDSIDLIVNGTAYAPMGRAIREVVVEMRTRYFAKQARVVGDRRWTFGLSGLSMTAPEPFTEMPVRYERAYGGVDVRGNDIARHSAELRNPVGRGFFSVAEPAAGSLLPNVEDLRRPQRHWKDRCDPIGFGAVDRSWQPRASHVGTYDADWLANQFPLLPNDFDRRHYQCAPLDQQLARLDDGEPLLLTNFTPAGELRLELPTFQIPVLLRRERHSVQVTAHCDTVQIEVDDRRILMSGRICAPLGRKGNRLKEVIIGALSPAENRAIARGKRYVRLGPRLSP